MSAPPPPIAPPGGPRTPATADEALQIFSQDIMSWGKIDPKETRDMLTRLLSKESAQGPLQGPWAVASDLLTQARQEWNNPSGDAFSPLIAACLTLGKTPVPAAPASSAPTTTPVPAQPAPSPLPKGAQNAPSLWQRLGRAGAVIGALAVGAVIGAVIGVGAVVAGVFGAAGVVVLVAVIVGAERGGTAGLAATSVATGLASGLAAAAAMGHIHVTHGNIAAAVIGALVAACGMFYIEIGSAIGAALDRRSGTQHPQR